MSRVEAICIIRYGKYTDIEVFFGDIHAFFFFLLNISLLLFFGTSKLKSRFHILVLPRNFFFFLYTFGNLELTSSDQLYTHERLELNDLIPDYNVET